jgi:hypothetical protein
VLLSSLCTAAAPGVSLAQASDDAAREALTQRRLFDPTLDSPTRSINPAVVLSAVRGEGVAEAQVGFKTTSLAFIVKASAPFSESQRNRDSELADLEGLRAGTTLSLTVSGLQWGPERITEEQELARENWCKAQVERGRLAQGAINCESFAQSDLEKLGDETLVEEFRRVRRLGWDIPVQYGFQVKVSPQTFDYLDPATLEHASSDRVGFWAGGGVGVFLTPLTRVDLEANYERAYSPGLSGEVCLPLSVPGAARCGEEVLGGPSETSGAVLRAGIRRFFNFDRFDIGVSPRLTYRSSEESLVLRAPIYFIPDTKGSTLIGGVAPVWDFDRSRVGLVLFVGPAFGLDGSPVR